MLSATFTVRNVATGHSRTVTMRSRDTDTVASFQRRAVASIRFAVAMGCEVTAHVPLLRLTPDGALQDVTLTPIEEIVQ